MGNSVSWLSGLLWAKKEIRILILGLVCATSKRPIAGDDWGEKDGADWATRITRERRRFYTGSRYVAPQHASRGGGANAEQVGEVVTTIPTIGFNVESVKYKNLNFNVWVRIQRPPLPLHDNTS